MVLSHIADKLGIWDILAPKKREIEEKKKRQEAEDEKLARTLQRQEEQKHQRLKTQKEIEEKAKDIKRFAKKQRVSYHSKVDNRWIDAEIIGVHLDDGPDRPYYTIKYKKIEIRIEKNGNESTDIIDMEKQTNAERLTPLPWDEEKTWEIIKN